MEKGRRPRESETTAVTNPRGTEDHSTLHKTTERRRDPTGSQNSVYGMDPPPTHGSGWLKLGRPSTLKARQGIQSKHAG